MDYKDLKPHFATWNIKNTTVFLRIDGNVPITNDTVTDDFRLQSVCPTLDALRARHARVILATHRGRPDGIDQDLSTKPIADWFTQHGYTIRYLPLKSTTSIQSYGNSIRQTNADIMLLDNLRFFSGEKERDPSFAEEFADIADYYVNDAWGLVHRKDSSVTLVPQAYGPESSIGILIEKELDHLATLKEDPEQPFVVILGGAKTATKIPFIKDLLTRNPYTKILVCPGIVFTFLKAQGIPVGKSLVDESMLDQAIEMLRTWPDNLIFPVDYHVANKTWDGELSDYEADEIPSDGIGVAIGSKSIAVFDRHIKQAKTIFLNGTMGKLHMPRTMKRFEELLQCIQTSQGTAFSGGGDTSSALRSLGYQDIFAFNSTGGGATLAYISGNDLPALDVLL